MEVVSQARTITTPQLSPCPVSPCSVTLGLGVAVRERGRGRREETRKGDRQVEELPEEGSSLNGTELERTLREQPSPSQQKQSPWSLLAFPPPPGSPLQVSLNPYVAFGSACRQGI